MKKPKFDIRSAPIIGETRIINTMCKRDDDPAKDGKILDDWFREELKQIIREVLKERDDESKDISG